MFSLSLENMEIDDEIQTRPRHSNSPRSPQTKTNTSQPEYATVLKRNKTRTSKNTQRQEINLPPIRSNTEISLRGNNLYEPSPNSIIRFVIDRQEQQMKSLMAAQTATFKSIIDQQEKSFQKSLNQITNKFPTMASSIVEGLLPSIIKQVHSSLAQNTTEPQSEK
jgi:hypothetical protein